MIWLLVWGVLIIYVIATHLPGYLVELMTRREYAKHYGRGRK